MGERSRFRCRSNKYDEIFKVFGDSPYLPLYSISVSLPSVGMGGERASTYLGLLKVFCSLSVNVVADSTSLAISFGAGDIRSSPRLAMLSGDEFIWDIRFAESESERLA